MNRTYNPKPYPIYDAHRIERLSILDALNDPDVQNVCRGRVLDAGCGRKPYKSLFKNYTEWIGIDKLNPLADVIGDVTKLPFKDETFDTILCTQTLQYVEEPGVAIKEFNRVLKMGGHLILTVPFLWSGGGHGDLWRFTVGGLRFLVEKNGFVVVKVKPRSSFIETECQMFLNYLVEKTKGGAFLKAPIVVLVNLLSSIVKKLFTPSEKYAIGFLIVARKQL